MSRSYDPRAHAYDDQTRHAGTLYILMLVIAVCFGGFVWQLYSGPETPRISAPEPYKITPSEAGALAADPVGPDALTVPETVTAEATPAPVEEAPPAAEPVGPPQMGAVPQFASNGRYVAQLAALQSEAAVDPAWRRLSSRAPELFAPAQLDVERADLGQRGIYYRVRAGYFADRTQAARFCERIRQMGQDCYVAAR